MLSDPLISKSTGYDRVYRRDDKKLKRPQSYIIKFGYTNSYCISVIYARLLFSFEHKPSFSIVYC